jgi:hypothetical protein
MDKLDRGRSADGKRSNIWQLARGVRANWSVEAAIRSYNRKTLQTRIICSQGLGLVAYALDEAASLRNFAGIKQKVYSTRW